MTSTAMERALRLLRACKHCGEFFMPEGIEEHEAICFARLTWGEMRRILDDGTETLVSGDAYIALGTRAGLIVPANRLLEQMGLERWGQLGTFYRLKVAQVEGSVLGRTAAELVAGPHAVPVVKAKPAQKPVANAGGKIECPHCHMAMNLAGYSRHEKTCYARFSDDQIRKILDDGHGHIINIALYDSSPEWRQGLPTATTFQAQLGINGWAEVAKRFGLESNQTGTKANVPVRVPLAAVAPEPEKAEVSGDPAPFEPTLIRHKRIGEVYCEFCQHPYAMAQITRHKHNCYLRHGRERLLLALDDGTGTIVSREKWDARIAKHNDLPSSETLMKQLGLHYWNEIARHHGLSINPLPGRPRNTKLYKQARALERQDAAARAAQAKQVAVVTVDENDTVVEIKRTGITGDRRVQLANLARPSVRSVLDPSKMVLEKALGDGMTLVRRMNEGGGYTETLLKDGVVVKESKLGNSL